MASIHTRALWACLLIATTSCGGSKPAAQTPDEAPEPRRSHSSENSVQMSAEIGALPPEATAAAFEQSLDEIQSCFFQGSQRIEFLAGDITFKVIVGQGGRIEHVFAERSTLGDRQTETCMFQALKASSWPEPVGGPIGIAENSFEFEMSSDVRPPVVWDVGEISSVLDEHAEALAACRSRGGRSTATVYVGTDGKALAAGVAAPDQDAESASQCLVAVLLDAQYPEPGSWPAKVSFTL